MLAAHVGELVLDQRVVEDEKIRETAVLFHDGVPERQKRFGAANGRDARFRSIAASLPKMARAIRILSMSHRQVIGRNRPTTRAAALAGAHRREGHRWI